MKVLTLEKVTKSQKILFHSFSQPAVERGIPKCFSQSLLLSSQWLEAKKSRKKGKKISTLKNFTSPRNNLDRPGQAKPPLKMISVL